ncbi:oligosaccharide flippase family protein [Bacteroidota bacterium]
MNFGSKISKNVISIFTGRGISLLLSFLAISLAARFLGVEKFGIFASTLALIFILSKIIDFGLNQIVFRDFSRTKKDFAIINNAIFLRLILLFTVVLIYNLSAFLISVPQKEVLLSNLLFINVILSSKFMNFREILDVPIKADLKMHYSMIFNVLDNLILLLMVLLMPIFNGGLYYFVIVYVVSNIPGFILLILFIRKKYNFIIKINYSRILYLVKEALPLLGFTILIAVFQQVDTIIIRVLESEHAAGIYSAAMRVTMPLGVFPVAVITTVFPIIVKNISIDEKTNDTIITLVNKTLFIISFIAAVLISFKSEDIIVLIFGRDYVSSSIPVVILFWSYLFLYINNFTLDLQTAYQKQKINLFYAIVVLVVDLLLIYLLLEKYSVTGVAVAKLIAIISGSFFLYTINKRISFKHLPLNGSIVIWGCILLLIAFILSYLNFIIYLITSLILILFCTIALKVFTNRELETLLKLVDKEKWKKFLIIK